MMNQYDYQIENIGHSDLYFAKHLHVAYPYIYV